MTNDIKMGEISRRFAVGAAVAASVTTSAQAAVDKSGAETTLRAFLKAFENDDLATMEASFDSAATAFDPVVAGRKDAPALDLVSLRRQSGMPPTMRALVQSTLKAGGGPPYRKLDPKDLMVQVEGRVAICTFHLENPGSLARRTIVLVRRGRNWKILHIHGSNAVTA
jgi:hypothetical protein